MRHRWNSNRQRDRWKLTGLAVHKKQLIRFLIKQSHHFLYLLSSFRLFCFCVFFFLFFLSLLLFRGVRASICDILSFLRPFYCCIILLFCFFLCYSHHHHHRRIAFVQLCFSILFCFVLNAGADLAIIIRLHIECCKSHITYAWMLSQSNANDVSVFVERYQNSKKQKIIMWFELTHIFLHAISHCFFLCSLVFVLLLLFLSQIKT